MGNVVSTTIYLTDIRNLPQFDRVYGESFKRHSPARTVLEAMLMNNQATVEISAIAARDVSRRRSIRPEGWRDAAAVEVDGTLFLSALKPVDARSLSIQQQTEQVMQKQEQILKAAGMSFADLVFSRIYLTEPGDYQGLNEMYRRFVSAVPPARATVHAPPVEPGHLLQIQSVAVRGSGTGRPSSEEHASPIHSYSVKAGDRLYITGMTGRRPDGSFARGDIQAQTRQALDTIAQQLAKHGMSFGDIVDSVVWLRDARHFAQMDEVYRQVVESGAPRSVVRIPPVSADALTEIMIVARKR